MTKNRSACFAILLCLFVACSGDSATNPPHNGENEEGWQLVWSDEFGYEGLPDSSNWSYDVGGHGWGNAELQYYTGSRVDNAWVDDGRLFIQAKKESWDQNQYTSARLVTRNKGDWTYGRFEIRARLPSGRGTWPAIWMLPTDWSYGNGGWPDNGEIDIMEYVGYNPGVVHASTHTHAHNWPKGNQKTATLNVPDAEAVFHVYALEWHADLIEVFVDSTKYFSFENQGAGWQAWPFDKDFHLLLNIAVGGNWGGAQGVDDSIFPQRMEVDYVRVYRWVE